MIIEFTADDLPSPERQAQPQGLIDSVRENGHGMKRGEREFLDSIEQWLHTRGFLTPRQRKALEGLHSKYID